MTTGWRSSRGVSGKWRPWLLAFGLAATPSLAYAASNLVDGSFDSGGELWVISSLIAAVASGMFPGIRRGVLASLAIWSALTLAVFVTSEPSCGFMSFGQPSASTVAAAADVITCFEGEPSSWNTAGWVLWAGVFCTLLSLIGGLLGAAVRWTVARRAVGD